MNLRRRPFLTWVSMSLCLLPFLAAACGAPTAAQSTQSAAQQPVSAYPTGPVKLTFLMGRDVTRRELFDNVWIPEYQKLHPNVTIELEQVPEVDQKMVVELATNGAPMVFEGNLATMQLFMAKDVIAPINPAVWGVSTADELLANHFFPRVMDIVKKDGQLYGIPNQMNATSLLINTRLFKEAGLDPIADAPKTWEDVIRLNSILTKRDASGRIIQKGFEFNWIGPTGPSAAIQTLILQAGGEVLDPRDGKSPMFDSEQGVVALELLKRLTTDPKVTKITPSVPQQDWADQQNAMSQGGPNAGTLSEAINPGIKGNYIFARYPQVYSDRPVTTYNAFNHGISKTATPQEQYVANDWIRWMALQPEVWLQYTGQLTPIKSLEGNAKAKEISPWLDVAIDDLKVARLGTQTIYGSQLGAALGSAGERVVYQGQDPRAALAQAKADYLRAIQD